MSCDGSGKLPCPACEGCGTVIINAGVLSRGPIRVEGCPDCKTGDDA